MRMKTTLLLTCLLAIAPAMADEASAPDVAASASALDLNLPQSTIGRNDPPGTWYGDTSGTSGRANNVVRISAACPTSPDGEQNPFTGSVTTGMGHSRFGNSTFAGTHLNYCKEYSNSDGKSRTLNISINASKSEGPDPFMHTRPHPDYFPSW